MSEKSKKKNRPQFLLYVGALALGLVFALRLNIPPVVDEVGSLGNTALLMGYDWTETLYAQGGCYFKYGYSILYYPLMRLITDSYTLYKACLALNVVINSFIPVIAYTILRQYFNRSNTSAILMATAVYVLPSAFLYTLYTKADSVLIFLPWPMLLILLKLMELGRGRRERFIRMALSVLLAFLGVYSFAAHTRGLVNFLAVVLAIVLIHLICGTKTVDYATFSIASAIFFVIDAKVSAYFKDSLFGEYGTKYSSVESYDFESLKNILTCDGFADFAKDFIGTAFNVLASTWGLAAVAVIGGLILVIRFIRHKSTATPAETAASVFIWLCFVGTFAMSCIYFYPYVCDYLHGDNPHRGDWLVYGRYIACASGPAMLMGLQLLTRTPRPVPGRTRDHSLTIAALLSMAFYAGIYVLFKKHVADDLVGISAVSRNFIQLCTFLKVGSYGITSAVFENIREALLLAGAVGFGGMCAISAVSLARSKSHEAAAIAEGAILIFLGMLLIVVNYNKIRISRDEILMKWTVEPCSVLEEIAEKSDLETLYPVLVDSSAKSIKHYQFVCKEYTCGSNETKAAESDNMFIIAKKKYFLKDYYEDDYYIFDDFDYAGATKDIVYIKGEELARELEALGYSISPYEGKFKKSPGGSGDI